MSVTKESFLKNVSEHELKILLDTPTHKHITLSKPKSGDRHYHLVTWPGYLSFSGDMGCFVFQRTPDMFDFFRDPNEEWGINPQYWAEKVQAEGVRGDGIEKFDASLCDKILDLYLADFLDDLSDSEDDQEKATAAKEAVSDFKQSCDSSEWDCVSRLNDWDADEAGGMELTDWYEHSTHTYTQRFLWCCHAIVWGIQQYDAAKESISGK